MAVHIPFAEFVYRPTNDRVAGNETDPNPIEFVLVPAEGPDLVRLKSIIYATLGLAQTSSFTAETQRDVIDAFKTGRDLFVNTVLSIRGLTVPASLAHRYGIIDERPADPAAPVAIVTGAAFAKVCGFDLALALGVAYKIADLVKTTAADGRFFAQPSGSGGQATGRQTRSDAKRAKGTPGNKGTVDGQK